MVDVAPYVEDFIGELFGITGKVTALQARHTALAPIYSLKRRFVQKKAISGATVEQAEALNGTALQYELESLMNEPLYRGELRRVEHVTHWLDAEAEHASQLRTAAQYAVWAALSPAGREKHHHGVLFKVPHKLDMQHLVPVETIHLNGTDEFVLPRSIIGGTARVSSSPMRA